MKQILKLSNWLYNYLDNYIINLLSNLGLEKYSIEVKTFANGDVLYHPLNYGVPIVNDGFLYRDNDGNDTYHPQYSTKTLEHAKLVIENLKKYGRRKNPIVTNIKIN